MLDRERQRVRAQLPRVHICLVTTDGDAQVSHAERPLRVCVQEQCHPSEDISQPKFSLGYRVRLQTRCHKYIFRFCIVKGVCRNN